MATWLLTQQCLRMYSSVQAAAKKKMKHLSCQNVNMIMFVHWDATFAGSEHEYIDDYWFQQHAEGVATVLEQHKKTLNSGEGLACLLF